MTKSIMLFSTISFLFLVIIFIIGTFSYVFSYNIFAQTNTSEFQNIQKIKEINNKPKMNDTEKNAKIIYKGEGKNYITKSIKFWR